MLPLKFTLYNGKMLTLEEIKLYQFYAKRDEEASRKEAQKQEHQRQLINNNKASSLLAPLPMPTKVVAPDPAPTSLPTPKSEEVLSLKMEEVRTAPEEIENAKKEPNTDVWIGVSNQKNKLSRVAMLEKHRRGESRDSDSDNESPREDGDRKKAKLEQPSSSSSSSDDRDSKPNTTAKKRFELSRRGERTQETDQLDPATYAPENMIQSIPWNPLDSFNAGEPPKEYILRDFGFNSNQTLAFKITVPSSSERWAINLTPVEHNDGEKIIYHFNPRNYPKNYKLLMNSKDINWGGNISKPLSEFPPLFDTTLEFVLQLLPEGFCAFINGYFASTFPHRTDLSTTTSLRLELPLSDDNGNPCDAVIHRIWWGRTEPDRALISSEKIAETIEALKAKDFDVRRTVYVGGLPKVSTDEDIEGLSNVLWGIFELFEPENVNVIRERGFGFVKLKSAQLVKDAIKEKNGITITDDDSGGSEYQLVLSQSWGASGR